ncbi:MAG: phage tail protein, partial [Hafnia sp.]
MAQNNFKAFAAAVGANVLSQADWEALAELASGFQSGKANSAQMNKAYRQSSLIAAMVGQFIANSGVDALDNGDVAGLVTKFTNALTANLGLGTGNPPVGIPFFWPHTQMPNSIVDDWNPMTFLKMNGSSFTATAYPVLAKIWPGLTLPDFRGEFVRIWDDGRGVDVGRNLLTSQSFAMQNITGTLGEFTDTSGQYAV